MWWKIYFWISIILAVVGSIAVFSLPEEITPVLIFGFIVYYVALVGLYAFVFAKKLATSVFWKCFFCVYVLIELLYIATAFIPYAPLQELLGFLSSNEEVSKELFTAGLVFEIPLIVALYKLARNEHYVKTSAKPVLVANKTAPKWGMFQTALWGYNTVFTGIIFLLSFAAANQSGQSSTDQLSGLAIFAPLLGFWLMVLVKYKQYRWNWWRTTLVANSLLYSGIILYGIIAAVEAEPSSGGIDIIGVLQVLILFMSLVVFGRDQFSSVTKRKPTPKITETV